MSDSSCSGLAFGVTGLTGGGAGFFFDGTARVAIREVVTLRLDPPLLVADDLAALPTFVVDLGEFSAVRVDPRHRLQSY